MYLKKRSMMILLAILVTSAIITTAIAVNNVPTVYAKEKVDPKVEEAAKKLGVSIKGLSAEKAKKAVAAAQLKMNQLIKDAKGLKVDITGLTIDQAKDKIDPAKTLKLQEALQADAAKYGVDITGLSDMDAYTAIQQAISETKTAKLDKKLAEQAKELGIDITGLSTEEANDKIKERYAEMQKDNKKDALSYDKTIALVTDQIDVDKNEDNAKLLKELQTEANNLGVDITGMTLEEAKAALVNEMNELAEADSGQSDSGQLNQFLTCALAVKSNDEATVMNYVNSGLFEGVKIKMQGLSYEDAKAKIIQVFSSDLGVDIVKSTVSQIKKKFATAMKQMLKNEADFYKVNISGLSDTQALEVIETARSIMMAQNWLDLKEYAAALNVDITGLSFEDGWAKVKAFQEAQDASILQAEASRLGISIKGMTNSEASIAVKIADHRNMLLLFLSEASGLGLEVSKYSNLSDEDMLSDKIFEQLKGEINKYYEANGMGKNAPFDLQAQAAKFGVDITGLSEEDAIKKVKAAIEAAEKAQDSTNTDQNTEEKKDENTDGATN